MLIADDSHETREILIELLDGVDGVKIVGQAKDGREAKALAKRLMPDVTVLDVRMPHCSGIEVLAAIKQNDPTAIVIMLTNYADSEVRRQSFARGADFVFDKGVELERFMSALRRMSHFWTANRMAPRAAH